MMIFLKRVYESQVLGRSLARWTDKTENFAKMRGDTGV